MKVLMVAPFEPKGRYKGGISSIAEGIINSQTQLKSNNIEIIPFNTCRIEREKSNAGRFNIKNVRNAFKIVGDLPKSIKETEAEVLYFHTAVRWALLKDLLALRNVKKKKNIFTILHIHFADYKQIMTGKKVVDRLILKWLKKYVDRIVFLSKKTKEEFVKYGIQEEKCTVIYNFSSLTYSFEEINEKVQKDKDVLQLLFVGSIDNRKGIFDILDCLTRINKKIVLHVCGECTTEENQKNFQNYLNLLSDQIVYHGYVSGNEKRELFLKSDILLLPSYGEGLPVVILEAFSAGCTVIASDVGANAEIIPEKSGLLITPGNREQLLASVLLYCDANKEKLKEQQLYNYYKSAEFTLGLFIENIVNTIKLKSDKE